MKSSFFLLALVGSAPAAARAQAPDPPKSTAPRSAVELHATLKAQASTFNPQKYSKLFADLADSDVAKKLGLSREQSELIGRLDELTRDIFRAWLARGVEAVPPPPATVLAERLSDRGNRLRSRLLTHAEAIALEGILDGEQARRWRLRGHQRAAPLLRGRVAPGWYAPVLAGNESPAELEQELRHAVKVNRRTGIVSWVLLGDETLRPPLILPDAQQALVRRVDDIAVAAIRMWLLRGLDERTLPKWSVLAERYLSSTRVADSIKAHAEAILLEAVLTPGQADQTLASMWKLRGISALLDPQFADRLRLTVSQRQELDELLWEKLDFQGELSKLGEVGAVLQQMPEGEARQQLRQRALVERNNSMDAAILSVLNPSQAREVERMLGIKTQPRPRPKAKRSTRPG